MNGLEAVELYLLETVSLYCCRFGPYFAQPVIAGLEADGSVYLAGTDSIGAIETAKDFMVGGTAPESLLGICESFWKPDMVCFLPHQSSFSSTPSKSVHSHML